MIQVVPLAALPASPVPARSEGKKGVLPDRRDEGQRTVTSDDGVRVARMEEATVADEPRARE